MSLETLATRIRELLREHETRLAEERTGLEQQMAAMEDRRHRLETAATPILEAVVTPRLQSVAELLGDAELHFDRERLWATVELNRSKALPLSIALSVGFVQTESGGEVRFEPRVRPTWSGFPPAEAVAVSVEQPDEDAIRDFLDERIVPFVRRYLELQEEPALRRNFLVPDPVCGMRVDRRQAAAQAEHAGQTYYFCAEVCRARFVADPPSFVNRQSVDASGA